MSIEEVALIFDYGGIKEGRQRAIAAMHELKVAKEREAERAHNLGLDGKDTDEKQATFQLENTEARDRV